MNNNTKRTIEQLKKGLDITNIQLAEALSDINSNSSGGGGGSAFEDYTDGGGTKTKEEFLPSFVESVDNSELFFILPEGTQFPYTLTEEDKKKLEKAKFIIINNNGINYIFNPNSLHDVLNGYWICINSESYCTRLLIRNNIINSPQTLQLSDYWAVKFSKQTITDEQKLQARTNIDVLSPNELLNSDNFISELRTKLGLNVES